MVAVYFDEGKTVILDGTMDMYEYADVPHHVQGKQLLISVDKDSFMIADIPITSLDNSETVDSMFFEIDTDGVLIAQAKKSYSGYYRYEMANLLDGKIRGATRKSLKRALEKGNNKFQLDTFSFSDYNNREENVVIDYAFGVDDYVKVLGNEIYVNMNLDRTMKDFTLDTTFSYYPIENDFKGIETCVSTMRLPEGYTPSYIPPDFECSHPKFTINVTYSYTDSTITQYKEMKLNFLRVEQEDYTPWNEMITNLRRHYNQMVKLTKE